MRLPSINLANRVKGQQHQKRRQKLFYRRFFVNARLREGQTDEENAYWG